MTTFSCEQSTSINPSASELAEAVHSSPTESEPIDFTLATSSDTIEEDDASENPEMNGEGGRCVDFSEDVEDAEDAQDNYAYMPLEAYVALDEEETKDYADVEQQAKAPSNGHPTADVQPLTIQMTQEAKIDDDDLAIIQNVMATITIPIPEWAKAIPEEKWMPQVILAQAQPGMAAETTTGR